MSANSNLPHGKVPFAQIKDKAVRDAVMRLSENLLALDAKIQELCRLIERS